MKGSGVPRGHATKFVGKIESRRPNNFLVSFVNKTEVVICKKIESYSMKLLMTLLGPATALLLVTAKTLFACDAPQNFSLVELTEANVATFSWNAVSGATNYTFELYTATDNTLEIQQTVSQTTISVGPLGAGTPYYARVRANCGAQSSPYVQTQTFTTGAGLCNQVSGVIVSDITDVSANVQWLPAAGAVDYFVTAEDINGNEIVTVRIEAPTTQAFITGLMPQTSYRIKVLNVCSISSAAPGYSNFFTTLAPFCNAPASVTVSGITFNSAVVNWSAVSGVQFYEVSMINNEGWTVGTFTTTGTTYTFSGLASGIYHAARVRTRCSNGYYSLFAQSEYFQTPYAPCPAPTTFTVSGVTENSATFTWSPADAFEYRIVLTDQNGVTYMREGIVGGTYTFTDLPSGTRFTPRITAICIGNQESRTFPDFVTLGTLPCNSPSPVLIQNVFSNAVQISWTPPQFYALGYEIEIRTPGGAPIETRSLDGGAFSTYMWVGLTPNTSYRIAVRTVCANGNSAFAVSNEFTTTAGTACGTPQNVQITNVRYTGATLSWDAVQGASFYELQLTDETGANAFGFFSTSFTTYELDELSPGSRARVRIIAYCSGQASGIALSDVIVTPGYCFAPTYTAATEIGPTTVRIVWTVVQGAIEYIFEYRREGAGAWTPLVTSNFGFIELSGLLPETDYEYRIATVCDGNTEDYIYSSFSTPPIPVYIWPGDANNDGVVNNIDLFVVCSAYGVGGVGRQPSQNGVLWQGYLSAGPWTTSTLYRGQILNNRFVDCNGDGLIDLFDVAATVLNRGLTHQ